ncbi:MAG TPA: hypothetical protein V6C65_41835, partial [Allocoleopsis sp.]
MVLSPIQVEVNVQDCFFADSATSFDSSFEDFDAEDLSDRLSGLASSPDLVSSSDLASPSDLA